MLLSLHRVRQSLDVNNVALAGFDKYQELATKTEAKGYHPAQVLFQSSQFVRFSCDGSVRQV